MKFFKLTLASAFLMIFINSSWGAQKAEIGPKSVWVPPGDADVIWRNIHMKSCGNSPNKVACIAKTMKSLGATPQAISFTKSMKGEVYMEEFIKFGRVNMAKIIAPVLNDPNVEEYILVNGNPKMIKVEDLASNVDITDDPLYQELKGRYNSLQIWQMHKFSKMQMQPNGGQRFIFSFTMLNGCRACEIAGSAQIAYDFKKNGDFAGVHLIRLSRNEYDSYSPPVNQEQSQETLVAEGHRGKVLQALHVAGNVYILVDENGTRFWAAAIDTVINPGDTVEFPHSPPMENYKSKSLNRTFNKIIFAPGFRIYPE
jgi:hypothetical protein